MSAAFIIWTVVVVAAAAAVAALYVKVLRRHLDVVADELDKPILVAEADGFWARLDARLLGWKTVILAGIAGMAQAIPSLLNELLPQVAQLPWVQVVDSKVATWITIICTLLIPLTHVTGLSRAAVMIPKSET